MIRADGIRSRKLLWFCKKLIRTIKELDVPAKAAILNGFLVKAWQQGDLDGGSIKAPLGAVITCSTNDGVKISVADYWLGAFSASRSLRALNNNFSPDNLFVVREISGKKTADELTDEGYSAAAVAPIAKQVDFEFLNQQVYGFDNPLPDEWKQWPVQTVSAAVFPYRGGEGYMVAMAGIMSLDSKQKSIIDVSRTSYQSNNSSLGGRKTLSIVSGNSDENIALNIQWLSANRFSITNIDAYIAARISGGPWRWLYAEEYEEKLNLGEYPTGWDYKYLWFDDLIGDGDGMPLDFLSYCKNPELGAGLRLGATFTADLDGVKTTLQFAYFMADQHFGYYMSSQDFKDLVANNPDYDKWTAFVVLRQGDTVRVLNAADVAPVLDSIFDTELYHLGELIEYNIGVHNLLYMAFPVASSWQVTPYDHVMFLAHDSAVYSWMRNKGTIKFSTDGVSISELHWPTEVDATGAVKPNIAYVGLVDENPVYICVSEEVYEGLVRGIHYGDPFAINSWTTIPLPEFDIVHVRPLQFTETLKTFLAVVKKERSADDLTIVYKFAFYDGGTWQVLSELPFALNNLNSFSIGLYGASPEVQSLIAPIFLPYINSQRVVPPYDLYSYIRYD